MVRTQISFDEELYKRARQLARRKGISFAELCRRSLQDAVGREPADKPWMSFAGMWDGSPGDSTSIDDIVHSRERP